MSALSDLVPVWALLFALAAVALLAGLGDPR